MLRIGYLCEECGICKSECQESAIYYSKRLDKYRIDYNKCTECWDCLNVCPSGAIYDDEPDYDNDDRPHSRKKHRRGDDYGRSDNEPAEKPMSPEFVKSVLAFLEKYDFE